MKIQALNKTKVDLCFSILLVSACCKGILNAEVFTVTHTGLADTGSLYWALYEANSHPGIDEIRFGLDSSFKDPQTGTFIFMGEDEVGAPVRLPDVTDTVILNGLSQPGAALGEDGMPQTLLIELKRNPLVMKPGSDGSRISGLVLNESSEHGISIIKSGNHIISYNFIGTDATGTKEKGNMQSGIHADPAFCNLIRNNLVSGNLDVGLNLNEHGPQRGRNIIRNNRIGTDITGISPLGNKKFAGVYTWTGDNIIEDNIIAFNGQDNNGRGIVLDNRWNNSSYNRIRGNKIFNNHGAGLHILGSSKENYITDNAIFNNGSKGSGPAMNYRHAGVWIEGHESYSNVLLRNKIFGNAGMSIDIDTMGPSLLVHPILPGQKAPILDAPVLKAGECLIGSDGVTVSGSLRGIPNSTYTIEVYGGDERRSECVPLAKPVLFLDGLVQVNNTSVGERFDSNRFTPDDAKIVVDRPVGRPVYESAYRTLAFHSNEFRDLSNRFPILEKGGEEEQDYYATHLSGAFKVASDVNSNGVTGEKLTFTIRLTSDDQGRFTLRGEVAFQVEGDQEQNNVQSVYHHHDSLVANYYSANLQTITLQEGQRYEFEGYHADGGGEQQYVVSAALGDVKASGDGLIPIFQENMLASYRYHSPICGDFAFSVGQPEYFLGTLTAETDPNGIAGFREKLVVDPANITALMATATAIENDYPIQTSEFSEAVSLIAR